MSEASGTWFYECPVNPSDGTTMLWLRPKTWATHRRWVRLRGATVQAMAPARIITRTQKRREQMTKETKEPVHIARKEDILPFVRTAVAGIPSLREQKELLGDEWEEVEKELVKVIQRGDLVEHPPYKSDWRQFFDEHLEELVDEAVSIVL